MTTNHSIESRLLEEEIRAALPELVHAGTTELYVVIGLLAWLGLVGTIGNALVLYVFSKKKDNMVSTLFILVMAIVDFTTCVVIIPFTIYMEWVDFKVEYEIVCKVYQFLITSNIPFSALIMSAIAIDRYLCICHPFLHVLNLQRAKIMTFCLALFAASLGIIVALMYSVYQVSAPKAPIVKNITINGTVSETVTYSSRNISLIETEVVAPERKIIFTGQCAPSHIVMSKTFMWYYQKFYTAMYLVCLGIVIVLYTLIYKSVITRRSKRAKQKSKALPIVVKNNDGHTSSAQETLLTTLDRDVEETCITTNGETQINGTKNKKESKKDKKSKEERKKEKERKKSKKGDKNRMANLKTAAMLFVVTLVFIVTFLPAFLMALTMIPYNMIVFYMYFANNVANPVIYSFMNRNFRDDLKKIFCRP